MNADARGFCAAWLKGGSIHRGDSMEVVADASTASPLAQLSRYISN
jgi:hypothetical protein